ncbi:hypothetical protein BDV98DRAFT_588198 [Pterulicium gracile]|uniref:Oxidoreductase FAD/NAD(P)-binding domain-containing protein n=1 Tax=Pterulicium gracile TaxID=1884261 RepID=A0A5C3R0C3_9AGAR|nr:hypothetical protein BDV98DRAFT_588198 [Pterula gracilis]
MTALYGWHRGERAIQQKLGHSGPVSNQYTAVRSALDEQHREFHTTRLPFVPVTTLDGEGRPWGSILAGSAGEPGFINSSDWERLEIRAKLWPGDPVLTNMQDRGSGTYSDTDLLLAGIGIEFSTRRRNKFAGYVDGVEQSGEDVSLQVRVNEAIGNCPKYINIRELLPSVTRPVVTHDQRHIFDSQERLPEVVTDFIHQSDTTFIGTTYRATKEEERRYPSHVGMNQRGGRRGFVRVRPSDGRTVVLPDYSGNRYMSSLGNIEATPLASLTFVNFRTGDVLYLTGEARNVVAPEAYRIMPGQRALTTIFVTGYVLVTDALPVRERPGTLPIQSPYSPPIRLLADELSTSTSRFTPDDNTTALLTSIRIHNPSLATFTFKASSDITCQAGQAAILDFTSLLGAVAYQHMAASKPSSVNDDRVRTWTISQIHGPREFSLTMREKQGGAVTGTLFSIVRQLQARRPDLLQDATPMQLSLSLIGISGEFVIGHASSKKLLWLAGGVGVTPFLSMLRWIGFEGAAGEEWDIVLVLSTREPDVMLSLISEALQVSEKRAENRWLRIDLFSQEPPNHLDSPKAAGWDVELQLHSGRVGKGVLRDLSVEGPIHREVFICGPESFESAALQAASDVGVPTARVRRENFAF